MGKFLSNDRKVILQSLAVGVGLIFLLSSVLFTESIILRGLAFFVLLAVYWHVPTWFSCARQLEKREIKHFTPEGIEIQKPIISEYKYFNSEGEEIRKLSDKEIVMSFMLLICISAFLIFFAYEQLFRFMRNIYPFAKDIIKIMISIISFSTPYLIRHIYCFILNRPMDTSFTIDWSNNSTHPSYVHKYDNNQSQSYNYATNPIYSYMPSNQYHYRHK